LEAATVTVGGAGSLVVLRTRREAYRVALTPPSFAIGSTPHHAFDVDRDGTAIVGEPNLVALDSDCVVPGPVHVVAGLDR
jgi:hypothetical protein